MADTKISALPASTVPLAGTEVLPIVQSSTTKQVSVANLTAGRTFEALGMTLTSTDAGAAEAPILDLYRDSATPAASDTLAEIVFNGEDSAGNKQKYACIHGSILSPTSGSEQGQIHFETQTAGASTEKMIIGTTNLVINDIGAVFNVRIEGDTDANLFYTDATNSRVGVGTISPSTKLDVNGSITGSNFIPSGSSVPTNGVYLPAANSVGIATNSTNAVTVDVNQNTGINCTPNANWVAAAKGVTVNTGGTFASNGGTTGIFNGFYWGAAYATFYSATSVQPSSIYFNAGGAGGVQFFTSTGSGSIDGAATLTQKMDIANNGIVTMNAYGAGAATFSAAGVISSVSDETWKIKDGVPVNTDEMLQKLEPGYWFYNDEKKEIFGSDRQLGFYAQNVHEAIGEEAAPTPEKHKDENGNDTDVSKPWGYYDRSVLAVVVMSLKTALSTIEELKQRITVLENK